MNECVIEWIRRRDYAAVTAPSGSALKSKLYRLAKAYPDEVQILHENKDGSVFAHIPVKYVRIGRPREISEEQRRKTGERFKEMWRKKKEEAGEPFTDLEEELLDDEGVDDEDLDEEDFPEENFPEEEFSAEDAPEGSQDA